MPSYNSTARRPFATGGRVEFSTGGSAKKEKEKNLVSRFLEKHFMKLLEMLEVLKAKFIQLREDKKIQLKE